MPLRGHSLGYQRGAYGVGTPRSSLRSGAPTEWRSYNQGEIPQPTRHSTRPVGHKEIVRSHRRMYSFLFADSSLALITGVAAVCERYWTKTGPSPSSQFTKIKSAHGYANLASPRGSLCTRNSTMRTRNTEPRRVGVAPDLMVYFGNKSKQCGIIQMLTQHPALPRCVGFCNSISASVAEQIIRRHLFLSPHD